MFGGLSFLLRGNMCCGIAKGELMVRVGPDAYEKALARKHARPMDFTGKPLEGYVYVAPPGTRSRRDLQGWIEQGVAFARTLPPK
jgi:TfoX/Sxy family transcriptional regulator of competence genes